MKKQLKNIKELFDYLMYAYAYELEDVTTKNGLQKRLKDNELEEELKRITTDNLKLDNLYVELKLGPIYNRTERPWIQIFTPENKSGMKGRYIGISFEKETNEIILWIGFGRAYKKQKEILTDTLDYKMKYSLIEPNLKYDFVYTTNNYDAIIIEKKINIKNFKQEEFEKDLNYLADLYKSYEVRFENSFLPRDIKGSNLSYEELNEKLLNIMEEIGNLAKAIKELKK